jgi:hypothetical protein
MECFVRILKEGYLLATETEVERETVGQRETEGERKRQRARETEGERQRERETEKAGTPPLNFS